MQDLLVAFPILSDKFMRKRIQDLESYGVIFVPEQKGKTLNYRLVASQHLSTEFQATLTPLLEHNKTSKNIPTEPSSKKQTKTKIKTDNKSKSEIEHESNENNQPAQSESELTKYVSLIFINFSIYENRISDELNFHRIHGRARIWTVQRMQREAKVKELLEERRIIPVHELRNLLGILHFFVLFFAQYEYFYCAICADIAIFIFVISSKKLTSIPKPLIKRLFIES
jgi:hypothetical protein